MWDVPFLIPLGFMVYAAYAAEDFAWEQEPEEIERIAVEIGAEYLRTDWTVR